MLRRLDIVLTTVTGQLHTPVVNMLPITADCEEWKINHRSRHTDREDTMNGSFHFVDQSFAETKLLCFSLSRVRINQSCAPHITAHSIMSSLTSSPMYPYFFVYLWISEKVVIVVHQNLISNWLTYLVHAKSTSELISFGFSDRSVQSLVSAKRSANCRDQTKKLDFTFWVSVRI